VAERHGGVAVLKKLLADGTPNGPARTCYSYA